MRRFRRLRGSEAMRRLVRETRISAEEMIYPIFVIEGENIKTMIPSMPGVSNIPLTAWMKCSQRWRQAALQAC